MFLAANFFNQANKAHIVKNYTVLRRKMEILKLRVVIVEDLCQISPVSNGVLLIKVGEYGIFQSDSFGLR
jgi:hypothetical protein